MRIYQICVFSFQLYIILFFFQGYDLDYLWPINCKKNPWCSWQDEQKCESRSFHQVPPPRIISLLRSTYTQSLRGRDIVRCDFFYPNLRIPEHRVSSLLGLTKQWSNFTIKSCFIILRFHIKVKYEN